MSPNKGVQPAPKWHVNMMESKARMLWIEEAWVYFYRGLCLPSLFAKCNFFLDMLSLSK